jgi:signal transduction histidine kinase/ligand-binding sensor domain-containing protein
VSGWILLAIGAPGAADRAYGLDPLREISQYVHDRWDRDRGFPGGAVHAIAQTTDGYLWIGTDWGLVRFDGIQFLRVRDSRTEAQTLARVVGLAAGRQGDLCVRLPGPNVLRYHNGEFEDAVPRFGPREDAFTSMATAADGAILLAGFVSGILKSRAGGFSRLAPGVPSSSPVVAIGAAPDGAAWLGTRDGELFQLAAGRVTRVARSRPGQQMNCLEVVSDREIWIGTSEGVVRWDGRALVTAGVPPPLRHVQAFAMLRDRHENLWVGTRSGLWRVNASGARALEPPPEAGGEVTVLFEDREGDLWTGSEQGIGRLRDSSFATYGKPEGLPSERNGPVHVDREGRVWFAPIEGGLYWLRNGNVEKVGVGALATDVVYSIAGGGESLWVGRRHGGLTHLWSRGDRLETRTFTRADGLAQDSVYAVHESHDGTVWAGTLSRGVSRLRNGRLMTYTTRDGLASDTVTSIVDDAEGTTWFATPNGLSALTREGWRTFTTRDGLPSDEVDCLLVGSSGVLWIGTGDGLAFRTSGHIKDVHLAPLSPSEQVLGLAEDASGWLWLATSRRVVRVKEADLLAPPPGGPVVSEFGHVDGLRGVEGVKRHRSVVADGLGRIWLSTDRGLAVVDPARLRSAAPVDARVVGVAADGSALSLGEPVLIPTHRRTVTFRFDGVSLSDPERLRFRYRLDGFDPDWSEPTSSRDARYTNLAPGSYGFRVRAFTLGQGWSGPETVLHLDVEPAFLERGWVRLAALLAGGAVLVGLYRLRVQRVTRRLNVLFEERLSERLRIAHDLHDTLLQGLASASMQLHAAIDQLPGDSAAQPLLERVQQLMKQVLDEGRDTVRGLRSAQDDPGDLAEAFARVPAQVGTKSPTALRVIVEGAPQTLRPAIRDEVFRIGREAVVNALCHAKAKRMEVELEYGGRGLRVHVRDDGAGIDPEVLRSGREGHFGLSGMRERAERVGGRLTVWSAPGTGTEVDLLVPSGLAYASPSPGPLGWLKGLSPRKRAVERARENGGPSR